MKLRLWLKLACQNCVFQGFKECVCTCVCVCVFYVHMLGYHHGSRQLRDARGGIAVGFDPNNPPYHIQNQGSGNTPLNTKTLDMDARLYGGVLEYDAHNIFGT